MGVCPNLKFDHKLETICLSFPKKSNNKVTTWPILMLLYDIHDILVVTV